jgi:hypothetical protein
MHRPVAKPHPARRPAGCSAAGPGLLVVAVVAALARSAFAAGYREPTVVATPYLALDVTRPGMHVQVNFPAAANAGPDRQTYWLTGGEDLVVDVQLGVGPGDVRLSDAVTGVLVVGGVQLPVQVNGRARALSWTRALPRSGATDSFVLRVRGRYVPRGTHQGSLLQWRRNGLPYPSLSFTVVKDDSSRAAAPDSIGFRRGPATGKATYTLTDEETQRLLVAGRSPPGKRRLSLQLAAERERGDGLGETAQISFLAFLDGQQAPLGHLGLQPRLRLQRNERAVADFAMSVPSHPRRPRTLVFFVLASSDDFAYPPRCIGWSMVEPGASQATGVDSGGGRLSGHQGDLPGGLP